MLHQSNLPITGTVLVADDQAANRELLEELLTPQGCKVVSVPDGAAALEELTRTQFDLVLLDVMMPHLNGFEVCEKIKNNPDTYLIPVIMITALSDKQDRIEGKDPYTHGHCERLSDYSTRLGEHLGLSEDQLIALRRAGIVHDVGKIAVPDAILLKPGRLTADEWKLIQEHPVVGERICSPLKSFRFVLPIIRHHHEKCDGSGYPDGLRGEAIPVSARVLQIVDVYDALTTDRPYKRAFSITDALQTMKQEVSKGWWDPHIFDQFEQLVRSGTADFLARGAAAGGES